MKAERIAEVLAACDDETKIAVVAWTFKHLVEHAQDGGTLRDFVYRRLGLPLAAYTPLLNAGGMSIVTHFEMIGRAEPKRETCRLPAEPDAAMVTAGVKEWERLDESAQHQGEGHSYGDMVEAVYAAMVKAAKADASPPPEPAIAF